MEDIRVSKEVNAISDSNQEQATIIYDNLIEDIKKILSKHEHKYDESVVVVVYVRKGNDINTSRVEVGLYSPLETHWDKAMLIDRINTLQEV